MAVFYVERRERRSVVPGFGGRYEVSDLGRVYSRGFELSLIGGRYVNLSWEGHAQRVDVAYLVARAFVGNLQARPYVIHKDGDLRNNRAENLEWSESRERGMVGRRPIVCKGVMAYGMDGVLIGKWKSLSEASEATGVARSLIRNCAEGRSKKAKGLVFRYI